ncbi:MAG: PHP domain-containing protein [Clostridia bacterium]
MISADLHTHSTSSDGLLSPTQLLCSAEEKKIKYYSISDHNTCDAYTKLPKDISKLYSGKLIPGVEISTTYNGTFIEVLAYNFDIDIMDEELKDLFYSDKLEQRFLFDHYYRIIRKHELKCNFINVDDMTDVTNSFYKELIKYKSNKKYLKDIHNVTEFARKGVYNPKSIFFVDFSDIHPDLDTVLNIIHKAKGKAFLAHVFKYSNINIYKELNNIILTNYDGHKFDGIEAIHASFTQDQTNFLIDYAQKNNLLISGGSDSHGIIGGYELGCKVLPSCKQTNWIINI